MAEPEGADGGRTLPAHAAEFRRALLDRLAALENELDELAGRYVSADGGPPTPSSIPNSTTTGAGDPGVTVTQELLKELRSYPESVRRRIEHRINRSPRSNVLDFNLRTIASDVIEATKKIQRWFTSPHTSDVPTALDTALQDGIEALDIEEQRGLITAGEADQLDTVVDDARRDIFEDTANDLRWIDGTQERHDPPPSVAVFRSPFHEASTPRYWPIVLGHELAHLKLTTDERSQGPMGSPRPVGGVEFPAETQIYLLNRLGILDKIDLDQFQQIIDNEAKAQQRINPPPPGLGNPDRPDPGPPASPIAARLEIANNWVEEVVCDLVMVKRFGPAAVAAMANFLTAVGSYVSLDQSHPPGYFRTRMMLDYLGNVPSEFDFMLDPWRQAADVAQAAERLPDPPPWATAMFNYIEDNRDAIYRFVNDDWAGERCDVSTAARQSSIGLALRQLQFGLPPFHATADAFVDAAITVPDDAVRAQEVGAATSGDDRPSTTDKTTGTTSGAAAVETGASGREVAGAVHLDDADVINAGWMAVIERAVRPGSVHKKVPVDALLLKSIEILQLLAKHPAVGSSPVIPMKGSGVKPAAGSVPAGAMLGREEISRRLAAPDHWRRIIVTPRIEEPGNSPSLDLRLGNRFIVFQRTGISTFNARRGNNPRAVQRFIERPFSSPFVLHPGEVVLASALEYIALPVDVGAQVITRSSYGRLGLITATAVQVHPLYRGCLTLELVNLGTVPLTLYPGERVAQLVFFSVQVSEPDRPLTGDDLFQGTYVCPTAPEFPNVEVDPWMRDPAD